MDKLFFGIERKRLIYFTCKVFIEENPHFPGVDFDKKQKSKLITLMLYHVKDEHGESLIFNLKQTQNGKDIVKFGMEQVLKLISQDIQQQKVTFFIVDEKLVPKKGQRIDKHIFDKCLKIFINEASTDSLKQMISHMNNYHRKIAEEAKKNKENVQVNRSVTFPSKTPEPKIARNINLDQDLQKLNRKRKLRALMSGNPKELNKHLQAEKLARTQAKTEETKEEELKVSS